MASDGSGAERVATAVAAADQHAVGGVQGDEVTPGLRNGARAYGSRVCHIQLVGKSQS